MARDEVAFDGVGRLSPAEARADLATKIARHLRFVHIERLVPAARREQARCERPLAGRRSRVDGLGRSLALCRGLGPAAERDARDGGGERGRVTPARAPRSPETEGRAHLARPVGGTGRMLRGPAGLSLDHGETG